MLARQTELLAQFMLDGQAEGLRSFLVWMQPDDDVKVREAGDLFKIFGLESVRNADAIVLGCGDHLLILKDRHRETPYRYPVHHADTS